MIVQVVISEIPARHLPMVVDAFRDGDVTNRDTTQGTYRFTTNWTGDLSVVAMKTNQLYEWWKQEAAEEPNGA